MVFEQLLQNGVCYAYLMRMLKAVLTTLYSLSISARWASLSKNLEL